MRMLYAYKMFDRVTYTQNRQTMARNCRKVRPPAKRRVDDSVSPSPIMVASLAQLSAAIAEPWRVGRDETVVGRDDLDASPQT